MTRRAFMDLCRLHVTGDDPPLAVEVAPRLFYTDDLRVVLRSVRASGNYVATLYTPAPGRQIRDFATTDRLISVATAKYQRWLTDFRGSRHQ